MPRRMFTIFAFLYVLISLTGLRLRFVVCFGTQFRASSTCSLVSILLLIKFISFWEQRTSNHGPNPSCAPLVTVKYTLGSVKQNQLSDLRISSKTNANFLMALSMSSGVISQ